MLNGWAKVTKTRMNERKHEPRESAFLHSHLVRGNFNVQLTLHVKTLRGPLYCKTLASTSLVSDLQS